MTVTISPTPAPTQIPRWTPERYVQLVSDTLRVVWATRVGSAIRRHLWRHLLVVPFDSNVPNASTQPNDWDAARPAGDPFRFSRDSAATPEDDTGRPIEWMTRGTGGGSDVRISFSPELYLATNSAYTPGRDYPSYSDAALTHELVHAVRMMFGVASHRRFDPYQRERVWGFENTEEYYATLIENMYRSERRVPLRLSYDGGERMVLIENHLGAAHPYIQLERLWVRRLYRDMPSLAHELERVPRLVCKYNPFADYRALTYTRAPAVFPRARPPARTIHAGHYLDPR